MNFKKKKWTLFALSVLLAGGIVLLFVMMPTKTNVFSPTSTQANAAANHIYRAGEIWKVDGEWEFTVNAVYPTTARAAKNGYDSKVRQVNQVLVMDYSYRNTGFDDSQHGAGLGLGFSKANFEVSNQHSQTGDATYPVHLPGMETSGSSLGNQDHRLQHGIWTYAFSEKSDTVTVYVSHYDSELKLHEAAFVVPVTPK